MLSYLQPICFQTPASFTFLSPTIIPCNGSCSSLAILGPLLTKKKLKKGRAMPWYYRPSSWYRYGSYSSFKVTSHVFNEDGTHT